MRMGFESDVLVYVLRFFLPSCCVCDLFLHVFWLYKCSSCVGIVFVCVFCQSVFSPLPTIKKGKGGVKGCPQARGTAPCGF